MNSGLFNLALRTDDWIGDVPQVDFIFEPEFNLIFPLTNLYLHLSFKGFMTTTTTALMIWYCKSPDCSSRCNGECPNINKYYLEWKCPTLKSCPECVGEMDHQPVAVVEHTPWLLLFPIECRVVVVVGGDAKWVFATEQFKPRTTASTQPIEDGASFCNRVHVYVNHNAPPADLLQ